MGGVKYIFVITFLRTKNAFWHIAILRYYSLGTESRRAHVRDAHISDVSNTCVSHLCCVIFSHQTSILLSHSYSTKFKSEMKIIMEWHISLRCTYNTHYSYTKHRIVIRVYLLYCTRISTLVSKHGVSCSSFLRFVDFH